MFGYIKTYKPEMKICEFDAYKAVYCTICKQLRKDYGILARFTLNYDYTFLAMLRLAASGSCVQVKKGRCPFNPLAKCNNISCQDASLEYACAVAIMMVYYKWRDTKKDEGFFKKVVAALLTMPVKRWYKKAVKKYPEVEEIMISYEEDQNRVEADLSLSFDEYAHPTADSLGKVFSFGVAQSSTKRILYVVGYNVGKWVYLTDALDDYAGDIKKHRFNPLIVRMGREVTTDEVVSFAKSQLNVCMDEACQAFDLLPKGNFYPILYNILFLGLENQMNEVIGKVNNNE